MSQPGAAAPRLSVVIPAHNERAVIGSCLEHLLRDAQSGEFEVVVVCNGCSDDTAARARAVEGVRVVETDVASKPHALNLGDEMATVFPRVYLDADVQVETTDVRHVADLLRRGPALAAAPHVRVDRSGSPWPVRAYMDIWEQLPYVQQDMIGSGFYALSREGRARFGPFPDLIADDLFVQWLFVPGERVSLADCSFVIHAPRTTRGLVTRKVRVMAGNREMRRYANTPGGRVLTPPDLPSWLSTVRRHPALVRSLPAFLGISVAARLRAERRCRGSGPRVWERDESARVAW